MNVDDRIRAAFRAEEIPPPPPGVVSPEDALAMEQQPRGSEMPTPEPEVGLFDQVKNTVTSAYDDYLKFGEKTREGMAGGANNLLTATMQEYLGAVQGTSPVLRGIGEKPGSYNRPMVGTVVPARVAEYLPPGAENDEFVVFSEGGVVRRVNEFEDGNHVMLRDEDAPGKPLMLFQRTPDTDETVSSFGRLLGLGMAGDVTVAGGQKLAQAVMSFGRGRVGSPSTLAAGGVTDTTTTPITMAPEGARAHRVPHNLLIEGSGEKPKFNVTQQFTATNKAANFAAIDEAKATYPDALTSVDNWTRFEQDTLGGDLLPVPPMEAIKYAQSSQAMADKLSQLSPEMKAGVDEGFKNVSVLRDMYSAGEADAEITANLFVWGILSRGAGPVQQESAYIDIIADASEFIEKTVSGNFKEADLSKWLEVMRTKLPEGSPGKQVTMNVNAAGKLLMELAKKPEGSNQTVLETLHNMMKDPDMSAGQIRRKFMELTEGAGIDNKVVSFILLVAGRDDVLVMDRIQSRHLWDDGRYEGANIYDGFKKEGTTIKEGLQGLMRGPRGLLLTEALEDGLRTNVQEAYRLVGRDGDASLGRFHWETWVIDGEQVVDHETLKAVASKNPVGVGVSEGKPGTFSSNMRYMRTKDGTIVEYPGSDGTMAYMTPQRFKEFEKHVKNAKNGIVPKGFKVTERTDVRWYERPEVDRQKLDAAAQEFANASP